jgi:hypothetical protein
LRYAFSRRASVVCLSDFGFGQQCHFPESLRGICTNLYDCGADGIYIFNFPCWTERLAVRPYHWLTGLEELRTAAPKPVLFAADHSRHRIPHIDQPAQLPVLLPSEGTREVAMYVGRAALPAWRAVLIVHSHGDIALSVNDVSARKMVWGAGGDAHRSEMFIEFFSHDGRDSGRAQPADCRTFYLDPGALEPGFNRIELRNEAGKDVEIERANLALW